ncbi:MAG: 50S ribosomal protein L25 [Deltaproteobacteria bacterium CG_4_10_14_0_2_um_filter_43_8]|nr:MAG: 50S ribosomal protein L25 [Deltaproteobacteria bacterium CG11_big_fil_rev_8_21_14_0_20_42_23]PJA21067.1 MAG: 50S ribosomal protein L25 [Deltaproteobacteria bacterium CG_4_10_14_0_2_um_filter_43_8]PJC64702.1 MAG: 50S ribosomal protein L25 [Deltaproteobacteria bacterium CG_4_9_14_0_2_um_filter_42_21]
MQRIPLTAKTREVGKGFARRARIAGSIPAVLYGALEAPVSIEIEANSFKAVEKADRNLNVLVDLKVDGGKEVLALVRDYQADPIKRNITHLDFQAISLDKKIDIEVRVELVGEAPGVKEGGILEQFRRTLHVKALPHKIPQSIQVDMSALQLGENIHLEDLTFPEGVEAPHQTNFTLVALLAPKAEEEEAPAAAAEGAAPAESAPAAEKKEG